METVIKAMMNKKATTKKTDNKIVVSKNGLSIQIITPNKEGFSWDWVEGRKFPVQSEYALCRCGQSKNKPFCDGTHEKIGFKGRDRAARMSLMPNKRKNLMDPHLFLVMLKTFVHLHVFVIRKVRFGTLLSKLTTQKHDLAIREANHCPSGRLKVRDKKTSKEIEHNLPSSIGIVEDHALGCSGPLWVRGGIRIESQDSEPYEVRNRVTLCRCGASANMPFCNGSHSSIKFKDGL